MNNSVKFISALALSALLMSACTFGDKGSDKRTDSAAVDTTQKSDPNAGSTGTGISSATPVNTGKGTIMKDPVKTDSTAKSKLP